MVQQISGYSHALFAAGSYLRRYAEEVDNKNNGGNGNGVIDGNEINKFKSVVKEKTGYDFDYSSLKQVKQKNIKVQNQNGFLFNNTTEIAKQYGTATTTKTIDWLNNKVDGKDLLVSSRKTLDIPYMDIDDFNSSRTNVQMQEEKVRELVQKQNKEQKAAEMKELKENTESTATKVLNWIFDLLN